ncbi:hypothetical protein BHE74_00023094 [Ensete ventricosum]|nr:hypothetical protein BHE74_00023094 [Ensete ventricosum]
MNQPITILIDTGSTNNFMDNKVAARLILRIEDATGDPTQETREQSDYGCNIALGEDQDSESWSLNLEDKADLKRAGLLGP